MDPQTISMLMYGVLVLIILIIVYVFITNFRDIKLVLNDLIHMFSKLKVKVKQEETLEKTKFEKKVIDSKIEKADEFLVNIDSMIAKKETELDKKIEESQKPKHEEIKPDVVILKPEEYNLDEDIPKPTVMVSTKPMSKDANPFWLAVPVIIAGIFGWVYYQIRNKN